MSDGKAGGVPSRFLPWQVAQLAAYTAAPEAGGAGGFEFTWTATAASTTRKGSRVICIQSSAIPAAATAALKSLSVLNKRLVPGVRDLRSRNLMLGVTF
jgi:hypothetical protein